MICCIYIAENPANQIYIGQTRNYNKRLRDYKTTPPSKLNKIFKSIIEHGYSNHKFNILIPCDSKISKNELNYLEAYLIRYYESDSENNLNIRGGGLNGRLADSTKILLRNHNLGKKYTKETNHKKGHIFSEKEKENIRIKSIGTKNNFYGRKHSSEKTKEIVKKSNETKQRNKELGLKGHTAYKKVIKLDILTGKMLESYPSVISAAKANKIGKNHIHSALKNEKKVNAKGEVYFKNTAGGYKWKGIIKQTA